MKITAQEEYGLRCLLQLAKPDHEGVLTVGEIARREGISSAYAEKLLRLLSKRGLAQSARGTHGGYGLSRPLSEITLGNVVRALGNVPSTTEICERYTGNRAACIHVDNCGIRSVWAGLTQYLQRFLDDTPLSLLVQPEADVHRVMFPRHTDGRQAGRFGT